MPSDSGLLKTYFLFVVPMAGSTTVFTLSGRRPASREEASNHMCRDPEWEPLVDLLALLLRLYRLQHTPVSASHLKTVCTQSSICLIFDFIYSACFALQH